MTPTQLRKALTKAGLTQVAFAERLGVNPRTVRSWVAGFRVRNGEREPVAVPDWIVVNNQPVNVREALKGHHHARLP